LIDYQILKKTSKLNNEFRIKRIFFILVIVLTVLKYAEGIEISVDGSWDLIIDDRYFDWGRGLQDTYKSPGNQIKVKISGSGGSQWQVDVRRRDVNWHRDFVIKLKTKGKETTVETTSKVFLSDKGNKSHNIKLILEGVSLQIPPDTYSTTVIYTVTSE